MRKNQHKLLPLYVVAFRKYFCMYTLCRELKTFKTEKAVGSGEEMDGVVSLNV